jgi:hypothetical protein
MGMEIKIKTPEIKIFREEIKEIIRDKATLTMAVIMAATEMRMLTTESHLNVE